jgi:hypothetical protein
VYVPPTVTGAAPAPDETAPDETAAPTTPGPTPTPRATPAPLPTTPALAVPAAFSGTWRGPMTQPRAALQHWTAVLALPAGGPGGSFQVRGYCTGTALLVAAEATRLVLLEVIRSDPSGRCANSGTVELTRVGGGRLRMTWVDSAVRTNRATGVLSRS